MRITVQGHRLASLGMRIRVEVLAGPPAELRVRAPLYRASIPVSRIARITCGEDDGMNHGLINWFVTGRASAPRGVRINNGGHARVEVLTRDDQRYTVVVDDLDQAWRIVQAVRAADPRGGR